MNKKKFCIGILIVLIVFNFICFSIIIYSKYQIRLAEKTKNSMLVESFNNEIIEDNITKNDEIIEDSIIEEPESIEEIENKEIVEVVEEKNVTTNVTENKPKETPKTTTKSNTSNKQQASTSNVKKEETTSAKVTETPKPVQENKPVENKAQEQALVVQTPIVENQSPVKVEEKYVRNDAMINKIKTIINNNPSEYMKTYGYEIIVDSSIKENTNQFTFTETRVKAYINNTFGTIKIYAEDYYKNGQLIMTECYIF